jgi:Fe-S cluster assembly iron-binding protein IscA
MKFEEKNFYEKYKGKITCAYKKDIYLDKEGKERCKAKRTEQREKYIFNELTEEVVLIECPLDCLAIEFEKAVKINEEKKTATPEQIKEWIKQTSENANAHKIDNCIVSHGGTSPYFYAFNFQNLIEKKEKECKKELAKLIVPSEAWDFLDKSNLGSTLIPIINRPHWKESKYNGAIHEIIEGKAPDKHKNNLPDIILQRIIDNERPNFIRSEKSSESDINSISITSVISTTGLKKRGSEYQGANVWHGSSTGINFVVNPSKNVWHCFRCNAGGSVAKAIGLNKGIISSCDENLSPEQFKEVLKIAREEYGLKKPEPQKQEHSKNTLSGNFIFDKDKIINPTIFSCHKIGDSFGYGFLLPKEIPVIDKKTNQIVARRQIRSPAVITSNRELIEPNGETENKFKIKYIAIPNELELRIDLETINLYLEGKNKKVSGEEILNQIKKEGYEKFLFFHNILWYDIHSLWDIATYFFQLFNTFPILELRGVSGSAKSKTMNVSRLFTLNPTQIMVNPSEASLFRVTHSKRPTKYIDEAEKLFMFIGGNWQSSPVVELINGSYTKGSSVPRLEKQGNDFKVIYYQCYSPTMIGSIAGLRDATETRAITHIMTKAPDKDKRGELETEDFIEDSLYQEIRNNLYLFALDNWKQVEQTYKELKIENLKKRDFQLWKPILTIAKIINEDLFNRVLNFAVKISEQRKQDFIPEGSFDYEIIEILKDSIDKGETIIYIQAIAEKFNKNKERKIANKTLSNHLDKLGFKEFREKNRNGSYLKVTKEVFEIIVSPIIPDFSSQSSQSSHLHINNIKNSDECVTNCDKDKKTGVTNVTNRDEYDEYIEVTNQDFEKNKKNFAEKIDFSKLDKEFEK